MTDSLLALVLIGLATLFGLHMRLQLRLRDLERRVQREAIARPVAEPVAAETEAPGKAPFAYFFENLVGGRLLIWVGGVALVVAAVFLIRYSIEIGLITPEMRMIAAALFGTALLALGEWAHVSKRLADDKRISQALVGAGLAVLYATVYGSYILYGFLSINVASVLMLAITVVALALSSRHGIGTAALGLIGGFMTPALVGDVDAGAAPLLAYIALLDIAVFAIAWRRKWGWLAGVAVLASFVWTAVFVFRPDPGDALMAAWFAVALGIIAGLLRPAGTSLTWIQPIAIAAFEVFILTARSDIGTLGWAAYAVIAIASVAVTRIKDHVPAVPFFVLVLGVMLIPVRYFWDESGVAAAAVGMIALFGIGGLVMAMERKSGLWAALSAVGFAAPGLMLRWTDAGLMGWPAWGALQAALALGPLALVFIRRGQIRDSETIDFLGLLPALIAAALLTLSAMDVLEAGMLSIGWLVLAIGFIGGGIALGSTALRFAGLVLLTVTVAKLFLYDTRELEGLLRILSFAAGGAALIVLGRFYGTLLRSKRPAVEGEAVEPA